MQKLSVNFYGEEVSIQFPKDFVSLKKDIAQKYELSLSDILEIDISYTKNDQKKLIKSEVDFKTFVHARVYNISLDVNESSKLYQKALLDLQNKKRDDLDMLNELKKKKAENKKKQEIESEACKQKIDELNNKIKLLGQQKLEYVKSVIKLMRGPRNKEKELTVKITKLGKEIGAPLVFQMHEKEPLPVKGETEKEKKFLDLLKRNTDCLNVQEKLYAEPKKKMINMDIEIKKINKQCINIIKNSQKEMLALKKEENNLVKEIIALEKNLGMPVDEKKPMLKTGFYFPNRDKVQIKTIKKEDEKEKETTKLKECKKMPKIKLPLPAKKNENRKINKKIENVVGNLRKNIKQDVEKHIAKTNEAIKIIREKASEKKYQLNEEDEKCLENCKKENDKAVEEVDQWIEFIFNHSHEIIEALEKKTDVNYKKLEEIGKKIGLNPLNKSEKKKVVHPGVICDGCNGQIIGTRYKCTICNDFDFCEKCEEKNNGRHGHPLLKINNPEQCPVSIKCVMNSYQ